MFWILRHQDVVPAGRYARILDERAVIKQSCLLHHGEGLPEISSGDAVMVLGGTMGAYEEERYPWLAPLKVWLRETVEQDVPVFAICLGAQLLSSALGGTVTSNQNSERGIFRIRLEENAVADPLFKEIPSTFYALQWHNDCFDLPPGATLLASSRTCPVQVFRYRRAYAIQFHPEVDAEIVTNWSRRLKPPQETYADEFRSAQSDWQPVWDRLLLNFLDTLP